MASNEFASALGNALQQFLEEKGITQSDAADRLGLQKGGRARINTYCHDSSKGKRPKPSAEILYLLCTKLGFAFEYKGYKISAATLNGRIKPAEKQTKQLLLPLDRQFHLTDPRGIVSVTVKQPPGHVEVSLSLKAAL
jgi:transcriptional regulator with XRE-family HTH domain